MVKNNDILISLLPHVPHQRQADTRQLSILRPVRQVLGIKNVVNAIVGRHTTRRLRRAKANEVCQLKPLRDRNRLQRPRDRGVSCRRIAECEL